MKQVIQMNLIISLVVASYYDQTNIGLDRNIPVIITKSPEKLQKNFNYKLEMRGKA